MSAGSRRALLLDPPTLIVLAAALAIAIGVHGWLLANAMGPISWDEGYIGSFSVAMIHGQWLPHVDAVSQRGPLLYWIAAIYQYCFGTYSWLGTRMLTLSVALGAVLACWAVGLAARRPLLGATGAAFYAYVVFLAYEMGAGPALNGEIVAMPFAIAAVAAVTHGMKRAEETAEPELTRAAARWLAIGGGLACLAMLVKQTALSVIGPLGLWCLALGLKHASGSETWGVYLRRLLTPALWVSGGWAIPLLITVLRYLIAGKVFDLWFYTVTYNREYYMDPYSSLNVLTELSHQIHRNREAQLLAFAVLLGLVVTLAQGLRWYRFGPISRAVDTIESSGLEAVLALQAVLGFVSAVVVLRFWPHHFIVFVPWLGLAMGSRIERLLAGSRRYLGVWVFAVGMAVLCGASLQVRLRRLTKEHDGGGWGSARPEPVCAFVHRHSTASESIFIWGFDGDFAVTCRRRPASRFIYTNMPLGVVPPFWARVTSKYVVPGTPDLLMKELAADPPGVVVEATGRFRNRVERMPRFRQWLSREYCPGKRMRAKDGRKVRVFARRRPGKACPR